VPRVGRCDVCPAPFSLLRRLTRSSFWFLVLLLHCVSCCGVFWFMSLEQQTRLRVHHLPSAVTAFHRLDISSRCYTPLCFFSPPPFFTSRSRLGILFSCLAYFGIARAAFRWATPAADAIVSFVRVSLAYAPALSCHRLSGFSSSSFYFAGAFVSHAAVPFVCVSILSFRCTWRHFMDGRLLPILRGHFRCARLHAYFISDII